MTTQSNQHIDRLERDIKELRVDYERFFNGALDIPPLDLKETIQRRLRMLRSTRDLSAVENFRIGGLEARFNSFVELYGRRLRDREEGSGRRPPAPAAKPGIDPSQGVVVADRPPSEAVEALYTGLAQSGRAPRFDLDTFGKYLGKQAAAIRQKTGCREVRFRLVDEGGEVKLKAKPVDAAR